MTLVPYLVCERILYASVSCMTKKQFESYLISERILYASVSCIRLKQNSHENLQKFLTHFSIILLISDQETMKNDTESIYRTQNFVRNLASSNLASVFSCSSVSYIRAYLVCERILYDEKIIWTVSYKRAYLVYLSLIHI